MRTIGAYEAKTHLPQLLERVSRGERITITKHGRPVARLVPADTDDYGADLMGSVTLIAEDDEAYFSTGEKWDAEEGIL